MISILLFFLFVIVVFVLLSPLKNEFYYYYFFCVCLFLVAAFRPPFVDRDYYNYYYAFLYDDSAMEVSFVFISDTIKTFIGAKPQVLFFIYAMLGVGMKVYAIGKISDHIMISLFLYYCYIFSIQELTGIRVGVATGLIFISIYLYCKEKKISAFICYLLACLFHISAAVFIVSFFFKKDSINKLGWWILIPLFYALHFSGLNLFDSDIMQLLATTDRIESKINSYTQEAVLNIFNAWQILRIIVAFYFLKNIDVLQIRNHHAIFFLKLYIVSVCITPIFGDFPVYAGRLSDLFMISDIVLIPMIINLYSHKMIPKTFVLFYGFSYFFLNVFYNKIFQ